MIRIANLTVVTLAASGLALSACSREPAGGNTAVANDLAAEADMKAEKGTRTGSALAPQKASFRRADGRAMGNVAVSEGADGVTLAGRVTGLPPGMHGLHLHEKGLCDGPKFESAGGHLNPGMKKHGRDNPQGAHLGDLANLQVAADGTGQASFKLANASMASGNMRIADTDGTALVIHAEPDDYKTDPSGASGDRIACAVLAAPN